MKHCLTEWKGQLWEKNKWYLNKIFPFFLVWLFSRLRFAPFRFILLSAYHLQKSIMPGLQRCNSVFDCHWFTFQSKVSDCILLKSCPTIDESHKECISGERRCLETSTSTLATTTSTTSVPMPSGEHNLSNLS